MKKSNVKRICILGICICALGSIMTGCGKKKETDKEKITLEVYDWEEEESYMKKLAAQYMKENKNITIHMNFLPVSVYEQELLVNYEDKKQMDCIMMPNVAAMSVLKEKGMLQNIEDRVEDSLLEHYPAWFQETDIKKYMLPFRSGRTVVYYNKTLFDENNIDYPDEDWSWDDYADIAVKLTGEKDGTKVYGSMGFNPDSWWWGNPAKSAGAINPLKEEDLELFKEAAEWNYDLTYNKKAQRPYTELTDILSSSEYDVQFLEGNVGMYVSGEWTVENLNRLIKEKNLTFAYDMIQIPRWKENERYNFTSASVISMAGSTEHPDEAYEFMKFIAGKKGADALAENGILPTWQDEEIEKIYKKAVTYPEHTEYFFNDVNMVYLPDDLTFTKARKIMENEVEKYLVQEQDLESTFTEIQSKMKELK